MTGVPAGIARPGPSSGDPGAVDQDDRVLHHGAAPAIDQAGGADREVSSGGRGVGRLTGGATGQGREQEQERGESHQASPVVTRL